MEKFGVDKTEILNWCRQKYLSKQLSLQQCLDKCKRHGMDITKDEFIKG